MDLQDVSHLFNYIVHHTNLTPENLWNKPVKTNQKLSFLRHGEPGIMTRMVEKGIQQQPVVYIGYGV